MSYWYMATPYRAYPHGLETAFDAACRYAAAFTDASVMVYSPIAHTHPIAKHTLLAPDADEWVKIQEIFMIPAKGMILVQMAGWERSSGIAAEIKFFRTRNAPIIRVNPGPKRAVQEFLRVYPTANW